MSAKSRPDRPDIGDALELAGLRDENARLRAERDAIADQLGENYRIAHAEIVELQAENARLREAHDRRLDAYDELWNENAKLREENEEWTKKALLHFSVREDLEAQRDRLLAALREIEETPAEVEMVAGECAYCESKSIARAAINEIEGES